MRRAEELAANHAKALRLGAALSIIRREKRAKRCESVATSSFCVAMRESARASSNDASTDASSVAIVTIC